MPVSLLDTYVASAADTFPATLSISAGSNRVAFLATMVSSGTDADPPTGVTLGGQSMSVVVDANSGGTEDVVTTIWMLDEAGIAAMSGSDIVVSGGSFTGQRGVTWSIQDAAQTVNTTNWLHKNASGGVEETLSLARAADSMTFSAASIDISDSGTGIGSTHSNPGFSVIEGGATNLAIGLGGQTESTANTSDTAWTPGFSRNISFAVFNIAGSGGPALTITDPIIPGATTTFSTSGFVDPLTGVRITDAQGNVKELTLASQTSVSAPAVGDLDYALFGSVTLEVYNATESATSTIPFNPSAGFDQIALEAGFATDINSFLYQYGGTPAVPDQFTYDPVSSGTAETLTLQANGYWTATGYGEWTVYAIDATDGEMQSFPFAWNAPAIPGGSGKMTRRNVTLRAVTRRTMTARP